MVFSEQEPVGMAALYRREDVVDAGELMQVWISPEYRGTGVAWDLMDEIFEWARSNNFRRVLAGLTKRNARALKFYTQYGFSILDESSANYSDGIYLVMDVK